MEALLALAAGVLYACGMPAMVNSVKSIAAVTGSACYADPFLPTTGDTVEENVLTRAMGWLAKPTTGRQMDQQPALDRPGNRAEQPMQAYRTG